MIWFGRHISLWNHWYNCTVNYPRANVGVSGRQRLYAKARQIINKLLKRNNEERMQLRERSVEIPLAIDFLNTWIKDEPVIELGCVLPYYILIAPNHKVYDLVDDHPANTKKDLRDFNVNDYKNNIISISTIEHISHGDYGIAKTDVTAVDILNKISNNAKRYFVTFPLGCNHELDEYVLANLEDCVFVTRKNDNKNDWQVVLDKHDLTAQQKVYGSYCAANTVCIVSNCLKASPS